MLAFGLSSAQFGIGHLTTQPLLSQCCYLSNQIVTRAACHSQAAPAERVSGHPQQWQVAAHWCVRADHPGTQATPFWGVLLQCPVATYSSARGHQLAAYPLLSVQLCSRWAPLLENLKRCSDSTRRRSFDGWLPSVDLLRLDFPCCFCVLLFGLSNRPTYLTCIVGWSLPLSSGVFVHLRAGW